MNGSKYGTTRFGDFVLDQDKRTLFKDGEMVPLMPKAFDLLAYLVNNKGRVLGKDELMSAVWHDTIVEESNLSQNISVLRRNLGEKPAQNIYIATIPGQGYKFVADVRVDEAETAEQEVDEIQNPPVAASEAHPSPNRRPLVVALIAVLILAIGAAVYFGWNRMFRTSETASIRTIAVLPFKPIFAGERDEALELGMADTLISKLSESTELIVRPIGSVRQFGSIEQDVLDAGRQLGVEAVLEGNLQRLDDKIRVNVRLLRTRDGSSLWSATYDEKVADIFALQDSISEKTAGALRVRLANNRPPYTRNLEAYQLYMRGRVKVLKATRPELLEGIANFRSAIEIDANYALAYAGMADAYRTLALGGEMRPAEVFPDAKASSRRAVEIDDSLAEAHTVLGSTLFWCEWNWSDSEAEFKRAIELNPNSADAHSEYAFLLSNLGRHDEALANIRRALELDPLNVRTNARYGQFLVHAGRPDEAIAVLGRTSEMGPDYWLAYQFATSAHLTRRQYSEALVLAEKTQELNKESTRPISYGGYARAKLGDVASTRKALDGLLERAKSRYVPNVNIAVLQIALGEKDNALTSLERAAAEKDSWMTFLKVEPIWFELRDEPRFESLLRTMKLE